MTTTIRPIESLNNPDDPNYYSYSNVPLSFDEWVISDQVIRTAAGWITQCTQYKKVFTIVELKEYFDNQYQN